MNINFQIKEAVTKRYSVRNYSEKAIESNVKNDVVSFIDNLANPFGPKVKFHYLDSIGTSQEEKLGTYGVIKGAREYIGTTIKAEPKALEALGYEMETVILYLASLGIGTCWLGGTFNRKGFAKAMQVTEDEMFPIITPFGYAAEKKHVKEKMMRKMIQADKRKEWKELFFLNDFATPLDQSTAGDLALALEMVRLGPSASNKQPWRVLMKGNSCHFYEYKEPGYSDAFSYDIQRVDMGIAAAHFDLAVKEMKLNGHFELGNEPEQTLPNHMEYVFSWVRE